MNKKFIGIGIGIIVLAIILVGIQLYKPTEISQNQPNTQPQTSVPQTAVPQKPASTGRNFVIELNDSVSVTSR